MHIAQTYTTQRTFLRWWIAQYSNCGTGCSWTDVCICPNSSRCMHSVQFSCSVVSTVVCVFSRCWSLGVSNNQEFGVNNSLEAIRVMEWYMLGGEAMLWIIWDFHGSKKHWPAKLFLRSVYGLAQRRNDFCLRLWRLRDHFVEQLPIACFSVW